MYNRLVHFLSRNKYYIRLWQGNSVLRSSNDHCKNNLIKHINLSISRVFFNIRYFICLIFKDKKTAEYCVRIVNNHIGMHLYINQMVNIVHEFLLSLPFWGPVEKSGARHSRRHPHP